MCRNIKLLITFFPVKKCLFFSLPADINLNLKSLYNKTVICLRNGSHLVLKASLPQHKHHRYQPPLPPTSRSSTAKAHQLVRKPAAAAAAKDNLPHHQTHHRELITGNCPLLLTCLAQIAHWLNRIPPQNTLLSLLWRTLFEGARGKSQGEKSSPVHPWRILLRETSQRPCQPRRKKAWDGEGAYIHTEYMWMCTRVCTKYLQSRSPEDEHGKKYWIKKSYSTKFCCNKMCLTLVLRAVTQIHQITQYSPVCFDCNNQLQNNISAPRCPCNPAMLQSSTFNFFFFLFNPERAYMPITLCYWFSYVMGKPPSCKYRKHWIHVANTYGERSHDLQTPVKTRVFTGNSSLSKEETTQFNCQKKWRARPGTPPNCKYAMCQSFSRNLVHSNT